MTDRNERRHCNSTSSHPRLRARLTAAKRFELSLHQLQEIVEKAKSRRMVQGAEDGVTLGEELGVPGFEPASTDQLPADLDLSGLLPVAHLQRGDRRAGIVVCRVAATTDEGTVQPVTVPG